MADNEILGHTALRGLAACAVVGYHTVLAHNAPGSLVADTLLRHSYLFVDLFFILSGFILLHCYGAGFVAGGLDRGSWGRFQLRRLIRIYPSYLVWLAVAVALAFAIEARNTGTVTVTPDTGTAALMHVAMVQSLFAAPVLWNEPLWSIAVEFVAYLLFPFLVIARDRLPGWHAVAVALAVAGLVLLARTTTLDTIVGWTSVLRCLCGFTLGMALVATRPVLARLSDAALSTMQLCALAAALAAVSLGQELAAVAAFAVLVASTAWNRGALVAALRLRAPNYVGRISYSVYLAHVPVLGLYLATAGAIESRFGIPTISSWPLLFLGVLAGSLVAGAVSYHLLECGSRRWLTALLLGGRRAAPTSPSAVAGT